MCGIFLFRAVWTTRMRDWTFAWETTGKVGYFSVKIILILALRIGLIAKELSFMRGTSFRAHQMRFLAWCSTPAKLYFHLWLFSFPFWTRSFTWWVESVSHTIFFAFRTWLKPSHSYWRWQWVTCFCWGVPCAGPGAEIFSVIFTFRVTATFAKGKSFICSEKFISVERPWPFTEPVSFQ